MAAHEFTISVTDLDAGGKQYHWPIRPAWVRSVFEGHEATSTANEGSVDLRASKSGPDIVVHGTLDAVLSVPCARCLEPYDQPLHSDISVIFVPGGKSASKPGKTGPKGEEEGYELSEEEADTFAYDGETVVLDDLVRDELMLEIPMIPLCSDGCPGISPPPVPDASGSALGKEIDPRLAPLLQFQAKTKK